MNSLEPATRRLLKIALNETTLTQFAFACASRVLIDEPMTVKEALASEHADEWQAAIDEEVNNLILYNCFEVVPRSEAMQHGKLVKSKWVFKVKYTTETTTRTDSGHGWSPKASLSPPLTDTLTRRTHPLWLIRRYEHSSL